MSVHVEDMVRAVNAATKVGEEAVYNHLLLLDAVMLRAIVTEERRWGTDGVIPHWVAWQADKAHRATTGEWVPR